MFAVAAQDVAIVKALAKGTLLVQERPSRFAGETYFAICDEHGIIEVQLTREETDERIAAMVAVRDRR